MGYTTFSDTPKSASISHDHHELLGPLTPKSSSTADLKLQAFGEEGRGRHRSTAPRASRGSPGSAPAQHQDIDPLAITGLATWVNKHGDMIGIRDMRI